MNESHYSESTPANAEEIAALERMIRQIKHERGIISRATAQRAAKQGGAVKARKRLRKQAKASRRRNRG